MIDPRRPRRMIAVTLLLFVGAAGGSANAAAQSGRGAPVALIIEVDAPADGRWSPYQEAFVGDVLTLGASGRATLIDYVTCEEYAVIGGSVRFTEAGAAADGAQATASAQDCPSDVDMSGGAEIAGVVLRSAGNPVPISTRPVLVFVGRRPAAVTLVTDGGGETALSGDGARFAPPSGALPLAEGVYDVRAAFENDFETLFEAKVSRGEPRDRITVVRSTPAP